MHVCFVVSNIHDKTGQTALALCNEFIKAGHHVHFAFFDLDEEGAKTLPQSCSYTFINGSDSLFTSLNPMSKFRKWLYYMKFWNATEAFFCFDLHTKILCKMTANFLKYTKPIFNVIEDSQNVSIAAHKYIDSLANLPKDIICFPDNSKILLIEFGGVGDIAQRFADIHLFKELNPTITVWLLVLDRFVAFAKSQPCVNGVIGGFKTPMPTLISTTKKIRAEHFDWITDISSGGGHSRMLILFSAAKHKFQRERYQYRDKPILSIPEISPFMDQVLTTLPQKRIFICAGASVKIKMYPAKHWIVLLSGLAKEGWGLIFCGNGEIEKKLVKEITKNLPRNCYIDLIDKTTLPEIAGIASQCTVALGNETGLLHIAALAGIPTLGIFSQPVGWQAGFQMPWYSEATAVREIGRFNWNKPETDYLLDRLKPETVREKFDELVKKCGIE